MLRLPVAIYTCGGKSQEGGQFGKFITHCERGVSRSWSCHSDPDSRISQTFDLPDYSTKRQFLFSASSHSSLCSLSGIRCLGSPDCLFACFVFEQSVFWVTDPLFFNNPRNIQWRLSLSWLEQSLLSLCLWQPFWPGHQTVTPEFPGNMCPPGEWREWRAEDKGQEFVCIRDLPGEIKLQHLAYWVNWASHFCSLGLHFMFVKQS